MKRLTSLITAAIVTASLLPQPTLLPVSAADLPAQMEYLDRGTVAVKSGSKVYLSWRLLGTEDYDTTFDVYRGTTKVATALDATNYTDSTAGSSYTVVPSGQARTSGKAVTVQSEQYITIPLDRPASGTSLDDGSTYTYSPNDVTPADVDGDGEYELILKWEPSNSFDSGKDAKHSGNVYIDAYKISGEKLWRIDLGININAGAHFTQIAAYDFDLDGKAELAMKTAPGSVDGKGEYVSGASSIAEIRTIDNLADYRHSERGTNDTGGRVLSGPEFYTVFQGDTGAALDTIYYPHPRGTVSEWGDNWGNRSERYLTGVAYLDGKTPSMLAWRGYYAKTTVTAYNLVDKKLVQIADFDTSTGDNYPYAGNGNHNLTVGDVDGDGCDEIICGSLALDNDLSVLWCSGRGHGDALHLADYDPTHDGLEYFSVHEDYGGSEITGSTTGIDGQLHLGGMTLYKAENGEELFHVDGYGDTGRGMMANVGYTEGFFELWGAGNYFSYGSGNVVSAKYRPDSTNQRIFWNGDLYDELFDGTGGTDYGSSPKISGASGRIQTLSGITNNGTKNNAALIADLFGDWREEIVVRGSDNESLLVYTTTIPTEHKLYTLMHDRAYRMQVAAQNAGYNQPPHISYYVNDENDQYDTRKYAAYVKTAHNGEESIRTKNLPHEKPDIRPTPIPTTEPTPTPTPKPTSTIDPSTIFEVIGNTLVGYKGSGGDVVIPSRYNGQNITRIQSTAFQGNTEITSVTIPGTITTIDQKAFEGCSNLESVIFKEGITELFAYIFADCTSLKTVSVPDSVTKVAPAFTNCTSLTEITLGKNVRSISYGAFSGCPDLEKLTITSVDANIGKLFGDNGYANGKLTIYGYTGSTAEIYANQNNIPFVSIGSAPTPSPTASPDTTASPKPTDEPSPTPAPEFEVSEDGVLLAYNGSDTDVVIPETVNGITITSIGSRAFEENTGIVSVTIPDTVTLILNAAFSGCSSLESVNIENVTSIRNFAFYECSSLKELTLNADVEIGRSAFENCYMLEKLTVPGRETHIYWIEGLENLSVYGYGGSWAQYYALLYNIPFYDIETGERIEREFVIEPDTGTVVRYNGTDTDVVIPEEVDGIVVEAIGNAFAGTNITSITMPDSVTAVYYDAFYGCSELKRVELSQRMTRLVDCFIGCESLEYIRIPASITDIEDGIFADCPNVVIYGAADSAAQAYAEANNIPFIVDETLPTPIPATPTPGPTATPEPYTYPYRVLSCSLTARPGYAMVIGECYEKKENAEMLFAVYNDNGRLESVQIKNINKNSGRNFTESLPYTGGQIRIFIWNMNTHEPYAEVYSKP